MNAVMENIMTRNSVRSFEKKPVEPEVLKQIMDAAISAPTAMNRQTFRFIVIENADEIARLAKAVGSVIGSDDYNFYEPAALVLSANDRSNSNGLADCACAQQNMFLAAHSFGVGSVWINQMKDECDAPAIRALLDEYGLPKEYVVWACVALGYAKEQGQPKDRIAEVTYIK